MLPTLPSQLDALNPSAQMGSLTPSHGVSKPSSSSAFAAMFTSQAQHSHQSQFHEDVETDLPPAVDGDTAQPTLVQAEMQAVSQRSGSLPLLHETGKQLPLSGQVLPLAEQSVLAYTHQAIMGSTGVVNPPHARGDAGVPLQPLTRPHNTLIAAAAGTSPTNVTPTNTTQASASAQSVELPNIVTVQARVGQEVAQSPLDQAPRFTEHNQPGLQHLKPQQQFMPGMVRGELVGRLDEAAPELRSPRSDNPSAAAGVNANRQQSLLQAAAEYSGRAGSADVKPNSSFTAQSSIDPGIDHRERMMEQASARQAMTLPSRDGLSAPAAMASPRDNRIAANASAKAPMPPRLDSPEANLIQAKLDGQGNDLAATSRGSDVRSFSETLHTESGREQLQRQISEQLMARLSGRGLRSEQITVQLHPRSLGSLIVEIDVRQPDLAQLQQEVRVNIYAKELPTRELLDQSLPRLRTLLNDSGMELKDLQVADYDSRQGGSAEQQQQQSATGWRTTVPENQDSQADNLNPADRRAARSDYLIETFV